jgi:hypothetical protein
LDTFATATHTKWAYEPGRVLSDDEALLRCLQR